MSTSITSLPSQPRHRRYSDHHIHPPSSSSSSCSTCCSCLIYPFRECFYLITWVIWLFSSITLTSGHTFIVLFTMIRIAINILTYVTLRIQARLIMLGYEIYWWLRCMQQRYQRDHHHPSAIPYYRQALLHATNYFEYKSLAHRLDRLESYENWKMDPTSDEYDWRMLREQVMQLRVQRAKHDVRGLMFCLQNIFHRSFAGIDNYKLYSVAHIGTKHLIEEFYSRIVEQLWFITKNDFPDLPLKQKLRFLQRARKSMGKTALCLSGGGAHAMYHVGIVKALFDGGCLPSIINGTSGGSIIAGVLATRTDAELRDPTFLNRRLSNRYGVRWLPTLQQQIRHFLKHRVLMDHNVFEKTAKTYYGSFTFEEAFKRTRRAVSITVSYAPKGAKATAIVLNYVTSPHVLIWSAVTTSCALPGLMLPQTLLAKNPITGELAPWYPRGTEFMDGSLHADVPDKYLSTLFNAQVFIVSQVNPHVHHWLHPSDGNDGLPWIVKTYTGWYKHIQADIHHRLTRLAKMKVIPKIYGADWSGLVGKQRYTGDVTIVPYVTLRMMLKPLTHPSDDDMETYIRGGERACWPKLTRIQNLTVIERALDECIKHVSRQMSEIRNRHISSTSIMTNGTQVTSAGTNGISQVTSAVAIGDISKRILRTQSDFGRTIRTRSDPMTSNSMTSTSISTLHETDNTIHVNGNGTSHLTRRHNAGTSTVPSTFTSTSPDPIEYEEEYADVHSEEARRAGNIFRQIIYSSESEEDDEALDAPSPYQSPIITSHTLNDISPDILPPFQQSASTDSITVPLQSSSTTSLIPPTMSHSISQDSIRYAQPQKQNKRISS